MSCLSRLWVRALARSWIATWYRTRYAFVLILCKSQRVGRVQDNILLFALRACMLRSHRIKAHATADTMHKPLGLKLCTSSYTFACGCIKGSL